MYYTTFFSFGRCVYTRTMLRLIRGADRWLFNANAAFKEPEDPELSGFEVITIGLGLSLAVTLKSSACSITDGHATATICTGLLNLVVRGGGACETSLVNIPYILEYEYFFCAEKAPSTYTQVRGEEVGFRDLL